MKISNGIVILTEEESQLEYKLQQKFEKSLLERNYKYISIPTALPIEVLSQQDIDKNTYMLDSILMLAGSAEQGLLYKYSNSIINKPKHFWAINQCYRKEEIYDEIHYKEFKKIEQYIFTDKNNGLKEFNKLLIDTFNFMKNNDFKVRMIDETHDIGYHLKKIDIQVFSPFLNKWIETHSCSYFGEEQAKRFNFKGICNHTISCTGLAFPRVLLGLKDVVIN